MEVGGALTDRGEAAGAWLAVGWAAAGAVLWLGTGGLQGEARLGWPSSAVTPVLSPGPEEGAAPGLGLADWVQGTPLLFGVAALLVTAFAPAR